MIDWILEILKESGAVGNNNETIVKYGLQKAGSFLLDLIITFICAAFFGIPIEGLVFWIVLFVQNVYWWISCQDPAKVSVYFVDSDHIFFSDYKNGYE